MTQSEIIHQFHVKYHEDFGMDILPTAELCTDSMEVLCAYIGKQPKCHMYGKIIGLMKYKNDIYKFNFHVHRPNQKHACLSNKMEDLRKINIHTLYDEEFIEYEDTRMGDMAFWLYTPLDYLKTEDTDSYELRKLIINITAYSRKQDFCKYFRKIDNKALRVNSMFR